MTKIVQFDFSHLYKSETVEVMPGFSVTIREVPHGEYVDMQKNMFGSFQVTTDKRKMQQQLESMSMSPADFVDGLHFLAIESWTLKDASGNDVPLSVDAWKALPHRITEQIEEVITRLNPTIDDDTKS